MERKPVVQRPSTFAIRPLVGVAIQLVAGWSGGFRGKNCRRSVDTWPGRGGKLVDRRKNGWKKGGGVGHGLTLYLVATLHIPSGRPVKSTGRIDLSFLYTHIRIYIYNIFFIFYFSRSLSTTYLVGNRDESPIRTVNRWTKRTRLPIKRFILEFTRSVGILFQICRSFATDRDARDFSYGRFAAAVWFVSRPPARKYLNARNFKWFRRDENIQTSGVQIFNNNQANRV